MRHTSGRSSYALGMCEMNQSQKRISDRIKLRTTTTTTKLWRTPPLIIYTSSLVQLWSCVNNKKELCRVILFCIYWIELIILHLHTTLCRTDWWTSVFDWCAHDSPLCTFCILLFVPLLPPIQCQHNRMSVFLIYIYKFDNNKYFIDQIFGRAQKNLCFFLNRNESFISITFSAKITRYRTESYGISLKSLMQSDE